MYPVAPLPVMSKDININVIYSCLTVDSILIIAAEIYSSLCNSDASPSHTQ